ncbi:hypothetical protein SteCoe_8676 [Stentor coeruleus]|uniref:EF-hand domain-containing protein n=1 Tax=Stentor coeruleus TaxID=5963 RepID=A0A1R2CJR7_9CILI|nr:hypothetical protein SteCoe_8676 [Stentor coeruleus]
MSSDESMSEGDLESGGVDEGANIRVVQSSMYGSLMQNSLFKVVENTKETEIRNDKEEVIEKSKDQEEVDQNDVKDCGEKIVFENGSSLDIQIPKETELVINDICNQKAPEEMTTENGFKTKVKTKQSSKKTSSSLQEIFDEKKKSRPYKINFEKRFYDYKNKVQQKIIDLQKEKASKELESCTFKPKTTLSPNEERKFSHFLIHMEAVDKAKKDNYDRRILEKEVETDPNKNSFKPTLCKGTEKIVKKNKSPDNVHNKLFKEYVDLQKRKEIDSQAILDEMCSFKPSVNKKSSTIKREGQINLRLFEASKNKKTASTSLIPNKLEKLASEESKNILREKFLKEITEILPLADKENDEILGFKEFVILAEKLGFIHSEQDHHKYAEERELCKKALVYAGGEDNKKISPAKAKELFLDILNLTQPLTPNSIKIHLEFKTLSDNKKSQRKSRKTSLKIKSHAFSPTLNSVSKELFKNVKAKRIMNYNAFRPEMVLEIIEKEANLKMEKKRKEQNSKLPEDCTFRPKTKRGPIISEEDLSESASLSSNYLKMLSEGSINKTKLLYNFSKLEKERKEMTFRTIDEADIEKNMSECTFSPSLEKCLQKKLVSPIASIVGKTVKNRVAGKKTVSNSPKYKQLKMSKKTQKDYQEFESEIVKQLIKMDSLKSFNDDSTEEKQ